MRNPQRAPPPGEIRHRGCELRDRPCTTTRAAPGAAPLITDDNAPRGGTRRERFVANRGSGESLCVSAVPIAHPSRRASCGHRGMLIHRLKDVEAVSVVSRVSVDASARASQWAYSAVATVTRQPALCHTTIFASAVCASVFGPKLAAADVEARRPNNSDLRLVTRQPPDSEAYRAGGYLGRVRSEMAFETRCLSAPPSPSASPLVSRASSGLSPSAPQRDVNRRYRFVPFWLAQMIAVGRSTVMLEHIYVENRTTLKANHSGGDSPGAYAAGRIRAPRAGDGGLIEARPSRMD